MSPYCTILLNPETKSDILAACIQANAAIEAGDAQAWAAKLSGGATLIAGVFALAAGWLAYRAATEQNTQNKIKESARVTAYKAHFCQVIELAAEELSGIRNRIADNELKSYNMMNVLILRNELDPANWERHALLSESAIEQISIIHRSSSSFIAEHDQWRGGLAAFLNEDDFISSARQLLRFCEDLLEEIKGGH